jgi:glutamyl-tRNA reductase
LSVLVVGVSHRTAPVSVLEKVAVDAAGAEKLLHAVHSSDHVLESTVLATCNRIEIYADVDRFHGSVEAVSRVLCELAEEAPESVVPHLYVHYDDGAVAHLFQVASGLDSMVVGESQILAQTRDALRLGQESATVGPALNALFQQALRVGKRSHAETGIDRTAPSLVSVALDRAAAHVGDLAGRRAVVIGAGAMATLAVSTLARAGAGEVVVVNRTAETAERLAGQYTARVAGLDEVGTELVSADVVVSCTGSVGTVLSAAEVAEARSLATWPLAVLDLALPHDVDPGVGDLEGVTLLGLAQLADEINEGEGADDIASVRAIVAQEVGSFLQARRAAAVTPTVVALRTMATGVVDTELQRLFGRVADLDPQLRAEVEQTVRRVADKLMHEPTVRVKELANSTGAVSYAAALAELFALDPEAVEAVTRPEEV